MENITLKETNNQNLVDKNLNMDIGGINLSLQEILGNMIVEKYIAQITPDVMEKVFEQINEHIFDVAQDLETGDNKVIGIKKQVKKSSGYYTDYEDTPLWKVTKNKFTKEFSDQIEKKIEEIMGTDEFRSKVDKVAQEILDYAVDGYKSDLITTIRARLIGDKLEIYPKYGGSDLRQVIHDTVASMMPHPQGY